MFLQGSLFGQGAPDIHDSAPIERLDLDATSWVEWAPEWLLGADVVFDELEGRLPWRQRTGVAMFDRIVDEPRLVHSWSLSSDGPEPMEVLGDIRRFLDARYHAPFDSIGFNLYRDGSDSVAWHGDRHRHTVVDPIVAIVSVGTARSFRLRPRGGGASRCWRLGHGDLLVMGGACQHNWEHSVPKATHAGPRISITFRHGCD
jgi:alkylated DNA repair dioxygenase AlkB